MQRKNLVEKIVAHDVRTAARVCSMIENEEPGFQDLLSQLYFYSGRAVIVGITGPPGSGKSTLLSCLIEEAIARRYKVGVIAVDPSSPLSGGALLADRLRIKSTNSDQVYIRSLATRGSLGGLAQAVFGILRVLEAMGKDLIFVETVGSGQNEIAVTHLATTTLYVTVPHLGDEIQALKAGILECADMFVVNKSDLGNAELAVSQMRSILTFKDPIDAQNAASQRQWVSPILQTSAAQRKGISQLFSALLSHDEFLKSSGQLLARQKRQLSAEIFAIMENHLKLKLKSKLTDQALENLMNKKTDPQKLARQLLSQNARKK